MPNLPISGLPTATYPLDGTELTAVVQGGITKQTTLNNLADTTYATNAYLVPVVLNCSDSITINLSGSPYDNASMFLLKWTGSSGLMTINLPDCTTSPNINRAIRFISDSSYTVNTRSDLTPTGGQTLDNSTGAFQINKSYEGIMVWSDGVEWYRIQTKA